MQTKHFDYVREIAHCGSITKAAENLWMSQQALSRILESIENEIGFKIFERTNKGVIATSKGEKVLRDFERIIGIMQSWAQHREEKYKVNILLQYVLSDLILDEKFLACLNTGMNIDVSWETMSPPEMVKRIKSGEPSWGILIASPQADIYPKMKKAASSSKLKAEIIGSIEVTKMCIMLRADDALAAQKTIKLTDLREKTFVINKGILVTETPQKLSRSTNAEPHILPITVNTIDYVAQHENTFTCLPGFIAYNNVHVKNGNVIIRQLADNLDENLCCYLLYATDQMIDMQSVIKNLHDFFETVAAEL